MSEEHSPTHGFGRAMTLNPSAGFHPVTTDPREVAAARRAGDRSIEEFPYYLERYGERGRLFALSDGAWIVTLCANPDTAAISAEVAWLATVLSTRGMPSLLLERHLKFMQDELSRAIPGKVEEYARLSQARADLEESRTRILSDAELHSLASSFDRSAGAISPTTLKGMGLILVSAVIDEAKGIGRSVAAVEEWAADPARFSDEWVGAVHTTVAEARKQVRRDAAP